MLDFCVQSELYEKSWNLDPTQLIGVLKVESFWNWSFEGEEQVECVFEIDLLKVMNMWSVFEIDVFKVRNS